MTCIGFIGGGNMAEALINGIINANIYKPQDIIVSDIKAERLRYLEKNHNVTTVDENAKLARKADIIILSVKPQDLPIVLQNIKDSVRSDTLIISIAAGVKIDSITKVTGDFPVIRVMPNTPALIAQATSAFTPNKKAKSRLDEAEKIFAAVGKVVVLEDESLLDAVTAVSGSGPAYYFLLMEEMIKAATQLGLPETIATDLVLQTAKGAALLAIDANSKQQTPAELRKKVTSPGGTTEAALKVLNDGQAGPLIIKAITEACKKSQMLTK